MKIALIYYTTESALQEYQIDTYCYYLQIFTNLFKNSVGGENKTR